MLARNVEDRASPACRVSDTACRPTHALYAAELARKLCMLNMCVPCCRTIYFKHNYLLHKYHAAYYPLTCTG